MGFFGKLKEKIFGKTNKQSEKYVAALDKSRSNFAYKLNALAARYRSVDEDYFYADMYKHKSTLEAKLFGGNIDSRIYYNLIDNVNNNVKLLHKYFNPI